MERDVIDMQSFMKTNINRTTNLRNFGLERGKKIPKVHFHSLTHSVNSHWTPAMGQALCSELGKQ